MFSVEMGFGSYICVTLYTLVEEAVKLLWQVGVRAAHAVLVLLSSPTWCSSSSDLRTLHAAPRCLTGASTCSLTAFRKYSQASFRVAIQLLCQAIAF